MATPRGVVGLAPKGTQTGRAVVGLAPASQGSGSRPVVGLAGSQVAPQKKGGGGFLHAIEGAGHAVAQKFELAGHDLKTIPGGIKQMVEVEGRAIDQSIKHPWVSGPSDPNYVDNTPAGKAANALVLGQAKGVVTSFEHPLRDPFQTLLNVGLLKGGVGKGIEGVGRLRGSEPIAGSPRLLSKNGEQVPLHASTDPVNRLIQGAHDKVVQHAIDTNPDGRVASYGTKRMGGSLDETHRYQQRMQQAPADVIESQGRKLGPGRTRKTVSGQVPRVVQQAALRLVSENRDPEAAAQFHLSQAAEGVNPKQNLKQAKITQAVIDHRLLRQTENGDVVVNADLHPKLAAFDAKIAAGQAEVDKIIVDHGEMTPSALKSRRDAPGRIQAGAHYEQPTPGKMGKSPALDAAVAERDRLASIHEKALSQEERWHAAEKTKDLGPLTEEDARARLAQLDAHHDSMVEKILPEVSPYGKQVNGSLAKGEQLARNTLNSKAGTGSYRGAKRLPNVKDEEYSIASDKLHEIAAKGGSPAAKALADILNERARLRDALHARGEAAMTGAEAPAMPRGNAPAHVSVPPASNPYRNRIVQIGTRLEAAQAKVYRLQGAAEKRVKPTGIVGGEDARPGRGFVTYKLKEPKAPKSGAASAAGPVVGKVKSFVTKKSFTGQGLEHGLVPPNTTGLVARNMRAAYRYLNTDSYRREAIRSGSDVRQTSRDVLVRDPASTLTEKIPAAIDAQLGRANITMDESLGHESAFTAHMHDMIPGLRDKFAGDRAQELGTKAPAGYKWVDKNLLGDLAKPPAGPRGRFARAADNINSAVTAATVYFKIGHIGTRVLTNAATNIIQGSADPVEIAKSYKLWDNLSPEDRTRALGASGQHGFQAMPHEGTSKVSVIAGKGANWWAKHVDAPFRFNSIAYEARKAGFDTPEKFRFMLDKMQDGGEGLNAAEWAKIDWVAKRANRAGIAYDRLNDGERRFITRGVWFYPWIKGATMFAGHVLSEHPYKSAVLGNAGVQGREQQLKELGPLPSYEEGLIKLAGADKNGHPLVTDFSTFSPFSTPADLLHAVARPSELGGFLNPVYGAADHLINGQDQYGGKSKHPLTDAAASLFSPTPEAQILTGYLHRNKDQSHRMFPASHKLGGTLSPLLRSLGGPGLPRRFSPAAGRASAERERTGR